MGVQQQPQPETDEADHQDPPGRLQPAARRARWPGGGRSEPASGLGGVALAGAILLGGTRGGGDSNGARRVVVSLPSVAIAVAGGGGTACTLSAPIVARPAARRGAMGTAATGHRELEADLGHQNR
jgi:hypothetical protein